MESKRRVVLVLPDSGPLISLSVGGHLDLLLRLNISIFIVDEVFRECTRDPSKPGAVAVRDFVSRNHENVRIAQTFVGEMAERARKEGEFPGRGLGEAAIAEFFANIDRFIDPEDPVLIIFEDNDIHRINAVVRGNVHLLSTWGFLKGMERVGVIESAEGVWTDIVRNGRDPHKANVDQEAPDAFGGSRWLPGARKGSTFEPEM